MLIFKNLTFWLALLGIMMAGSLIIRLRAGLQEPVPPPPIPPIVKPFARSLGAAGLVEASRENTALGVPSPGLVAIVHVQVWDRVEEGQPLLTLDTRDLQALLETQKSQVAVASASLDRTRGQLARLQSVSDQRAIMAEEVQLRQSDLIVAEAQLAAARAACAQTVTLIDRMVVRAPRSGTILQVNTRLGEFAVPGSLPAPIVLGDIDEFQVRADVDEQMAPRIRPGARAVACVKGDSAHPIDLTFVRIEPFIIPKRSLTGNSLERVDTRVLQVIFKFTAPPDRPVYVGQQMDLYIEEIP